MGSNAAGNTYTLIPSSTSALFFYAYDTLALLVLDLGQVASSRCFIGATSCRLHFRHQTSSYEVIDLGGSRFRDWDNKD